MALKARVGEEAGPTDSIVQYVPSGVPGGRAPHFWLGPGREIGDSLFDRLGIGFTLLRLGPKARPATSLSAAAHERGVPLDILDVIDPSIRELYGADLVLLRPDQHIAWRNNACPDDAGVILARATGA